jgi:uncharacterized RDD family membrane protein YckC
MDNSPPEIIDPQPRRLSAAPLGRRVGASLLDNAAALLVIYPATFLLSSAENVAPLVIVLCVGLNQALVVGWTLCRDAWWRGQGIGKRMAAVLIVESRTGAPASRLRCVWRQTIFTLIVLAVYLPIYLNSFPSPAILPQAVISSLLSVAIPVRLPMFLLPQQQTDSGEMLIAHILVLGFILLEALLAFSRSDARRIIDFLAGTRVADGKAVSSPVT